MGDVTVRVLGPGDEALVEAFLKPRLDASMFLLANSRRAGLAYRDALYHGVYAGAFNSNGELVALASHFWNDVMNLQAPMHLEAVCRAAAEESGRPIRGAVGPADQAAACVALYGLPETGDAVQLNEHEDLYALDLEELRLPEALVNGRVIGRRLEARDREPFIDMMRAYQIDDAGHKPGEELERRLVEFYEYGLAEPERWVAESGGRVVAMSGFNARIAEAVQVGGVYTPPELRGRGYGRCAVAASLRDMRSAGARRAILFTGIENQPAIRVYESLGFRRIGNYRILILHEGVKPV